MGHARSLGGPAGPNQGVLCWDAQGGIPGGRRPGPQLRLQKYHHKGLGIVAPGAGGGVTVWASLIYPIMKLHGVQVAAKGLGEAPLHGGGTPRADDNGEAETSGKSRPPGQTVMARSSHQV